MNADQDQKRLQGLPKNISAMICANLRRMLLGFLNGRTPDGLRVQHCTFHETEPAIDADGPRIIFVDRQEWAFTLETNAFDQSAHDGCRESSAFEFELGGDGGDLAVAGNMKAHTAHRD